MPSIDSSYTYIYSTLIMHGFPNRSIATTYGPLGFMAHTLDIDHLKLISCVVSTLLGVATGYMLYLLLRQIKNRPIRYLLAALGALLVTWQVYEWKLMAIILLLVLCAYLRRSKKILYILTVACTLALYTKLSLGIAVIAVLIVLCLLLKVSLKTYLYLVGCGLMALFLGGLIFFGSLHQAFTYLYYGIDVSKGYSESMGVGPTDWHSVVELMLIGIAAVYGAATLLLAKGSRGFLLVLLAASFFVWKASITRQDPYGHVESMMYFLAFVAYVIMLLAVHRPIKEKKLVHIYAPSVLVVAGVLITAWSAHVSGLTFKRVDTALTAPLTFWKVETCTLGPCVPESGLALNPKMKSELSNNTVDIFPWETLFAKANNLNWDPRPSPASYGAYVPALDKLDANFLSSSQGPKYIIWDMREGILGIDGRNKFLDEPATLTAMLNHYGYDSQYGPLVLLKHSSSSQATSNTAYGQPTSLKWQTWYSLPSTSSESLVSIKYKPDIQQQVGSILFRPTPILIEAKKKSGAVATFRTAPANMVDGMLLSQLPFNDDEMISVLKHQPLQDPVVQYQLVGGDKGSLSASYTK